MAARKKKLERLTFEQIKAAADLKEEEVEIPEWEGSALVRGATREEWDRYMELESPDDVAFLLSKTLLEPSLEPDQIRQLRSEKGAMAFGRIEAKVMILSGFGAAAEDAERRFRPGGTE